MSNIVGIPTTRVSDLFVRQRMMQQVQSDQLELFRIQTQMSTGRRFQLPGEEPLAAARVISLQGLLERKDQVRKNLATSQSYLTSTDTAMSTISRLSAEIRGASLAVVGTTATDEQRRSAAMQVEQAIRQLMDAGNQKFRGRYLFAGSSTVVQPFRQTDAGYANYQGDQGKLLSYSDVDLLVETNMTGDEVFGALSAPVRSVDLRPVVSSRTRLADLRQGQGISRGAIYISDGFNYSLVDISSAETLGDVAALIRNHPPEDRTVDVEITSRGLKIQIADDDPLNPPNLTVREVGGGTTAAELGILAKNGVGNAPVEGEDLEPVVRKTTPLADILGARARALLRTPGPDNDLIIEATHRGASYNGVQVYFHDDPTVTFGNEQAVFDPLNHRIDIAIDQDNTRAEHVVDAVSRAYELDPLAMPFQARLDPLDDKYSPGQGLITIPPGGQPSGETAYGEGADLDQASGLQIRNGGETHVLDISGAETVEDLLNLLNGSEAGLLAKIAEDGSGIEVYSRLSGADFAIGENGGQTAAQLGLRTFTDQTRLADMNFGRGMARYVGPPGGTDFTIVRSDGVRLEIDLAGAETVDDVLQAIRNHAGNADGNLDARLALYGNGLELVDASLGPGPLTVERGQTSLAAIDLGLIPKGEYSSAAVDPGGGQPQVFTGSDSNPQETDGLFNALIRLQTALRSNDLQEVQRSIGLLDSAVLEMNFSRADLGARQQGLDVLKGRLDSEDTELREMLSLEHDADLAEVISNLTARQMALEAGLRATAQIFDLTLLNYL